MPDGMMLYRSSEMQSQLVLRALGMALRRTQEL